MSSSVPQRTHDIQGIAATLNYYSIQEYSYLLVKIAHRFLTENSQN